MITKQTLQNANKLTYLATQYPEHKLEDLLALLQLPAIDINAAGWAAVELGWLAEPNKETGEITVLSTPDTWDFGQVQADLQDTLLFCFEQLAKQETDLEETYLSNWAMGYSSQDLLITIKQLLAERRLAEYTIHDGENEYKFYTLFENLEQQWGRKQFKTDPAPKKKGKK